jgi:hypothetical protein
MQGHEDQNGSWHELARRPAPVDRRVLWQALIDKTEHPEHYNDGVRGAEVIDHGACVVVRRTYPDRGEPFVEWIEHEIRSVRVETRRSGCGWRRAQALVDTPEGPCLVYEVDDLEAAEEAGGITALHADRVLEQLLAAARGEQAH